MLTQILDATDMTLAQFLFLSLIVFGTTCLILFATWYDHKHGVE
ncbi:conserved hypothetical protein [Vibrio owensii]|uniref:Uncharacterized protein n=1 Tax=Vibrio owensii TaxID=696485 RepID=A0AAU9QAM4_9VIBR|nr:conserved hypothetical protein [Vibrio owensii]